MVSSIRRMDHLCRIWPHRDESRAACGAHRVRPQHRTYSDGQRYGSLAIGFYRRRRALRISSRPPWYALGVTPGRTIDRRVGVGSKYCR